MLVLVLMDNASKPFGCSIVYVDLESLDKTPSFSSAFVGFLTVVGNFGSNVSPLLEEARCAKIISSVGSVKCVVSSIASYDIIVFVQDPLASSMVAGSSHACIFGSLS